MLTELAVGRPGLAFLVDFEGQAIDEHRAAADKLNIVSRGIFQDHAPLQGFFLQVQGEQRGIFELAEAPLVGVGDEGDEFRLQDQISLGWVGGINRRYRAGDQFAGFHQAVKQAGSRHLIVVRFVGNINLTIECIVYAKEKTRRVAKRCRVRVRFNRHPLSCPPLFPGVLLEPWSLRRSV